MIVTKAHITTFLQRQELFNFLLNTAGNVLVYVDQTKNTFAPKCEREILYRPRHWKPSVWILVVGLQVIHGGLYVALGHLSDILCCCTTMLVSWCLTLALVSLDYVSGGSTMVSISELGCDWLNTTTEPPGPVSCASHWPRHRPIIKDGRNLRDHGSKDAISWSLYLAWSLSSKNNYLNRRCNQ